MKYDQRHLNALLEMIDSILNDEDNVSFKSELGRRFTESNILELQGHQSDRALALSLFGRRFRKEAAVFYKAISHTGLKNELCNYYKTMRVSHLTGDYVAYGLNSSLQLESIFSYLCVELDAWSIIENRVQTNQDTKLITGYNNLNQPYTLDLATKFFKNGSRLGISFVDFKAKALFCLNRFQIQYLNNWKNFTDLYALRNYSSHTKTTSGDEGRVRDILERFQRNIGFYEITLASYKTCLDLHFKGSGN